MPLTRRQLLGLAAALPLAPLPALAAGPSSSRKFLLIYNHGGWDTTRTLSPMFGAPGVAVEKKAEPYTVGDLAVVDHPDRPSVRAFFDRHHRAVSLVHGILVPSVAHEACTRLLFTGSSRDGGDDPDWGARIAGAEADAFVLPNLVLDAPTFPGPYALSVARSGENGQLDGLIDGSLLDRSGVDPLPPSVQGAIDRRVLRRAEAAAADPAFADLAEAEARAVALKAERYAIRFGTGGDLGTRTRVAADALSSGLSRVVTIGWPSLLFPWDSHYDNDPLQSALWEQLFSGLLQTVDQLSASPGQSGGTLLDETVVMVFSEMGRTPALNSADGKDHWPWASLLMFGGGVRGGVTVGGYSDGFAGSPTDRATGEVAAAGPLLDPAAIGATLLRLAGLEPGAEPIGALLEDG